MELFWTDVAGQVQLVEFDATLREEHVGASTPTRYPIEGNAGSVDHAVLEPVTRIYDVYVSDSPPHVPESHMFGVRGSFESVRVTTGDEGEKGASSSARVLAFDGPVRRRERVFAELEHLRTQRALVSVSATLDALDDMLITKVGAPLETRDGDGITFRLELQQITYGEAVVVQVPDPEQPRGRRSVDAGATSTSEADPELESIWHRLSGL